MTFFTLLTGSVRVPEHRFAEAKKRVEEFFQSLASEFEVPSPLVVVTKSEAVSKGESPQPAAPRGRLTENELEMVTAARGKIISPRPHPNFFAK